MLADVTGNAATGDVQFQLFSDDGNGYFVKDTLQYDTGSLTGVTAIGAVPFVIITSGDYSLTAVMTVNTVGIGSNDIDGRISTQEQILAGELLPIGNMSLIIAGMQTSAIWFAPIVASGIGLAAFQIKKRYF